MYYHCVPICTLNNIKNHSCKLLHYNTITVWKCSGYGHECVQNYAWKFKCTLGGMICLSTFSGKLDIDEALLWSS